MTAWDEHRAPDPELIDDCVHCGFCLPTCPSYAVFGTEMDSPRGRIVLMRVGHDPNTTLSDELRLHFDRCLGCMACVTACPSGVQYDRLIEQVRPQLERHVPRKRGERLLAATVLGTFTRPGVVRAVVPLLAAQRRLRLRPLLRQLPGRRLRTLASLAPDVALPAAWRRLAAVTPASPTVTARGRVAFLQGCVQRALFGDVNAATVRVLAAEGWEVDAPRQPACCGALHFHSGAEATAAARAKAVIARYEAYDAVVVNVAGCGSAMKDYGRLLDGDPVWARRAEAFSARVVDVHELLDRYPAQAMRHRLELTVAYHDACHLAHAQRVRLQPRNVLRSIPGLTVVEPAGWELCCGSAGIYNVMQPDAAAELGRRKAASLLATGAKVVAAANPGCAMQIAAHVPPGTLRILHPMTLLDASLRGVQP